ncbi:unnamed protein product [Macrosiphum euphorbiae]|uniref:HAT C-terminal dimerisation domain-containing protein n=1 Tax=Macrosiphum euphorbiae TaxID=13131 RepID=A0AAV0WQN7_9HEMI|nr:unnamed protein product [Macrosiphum euphorbiae]
MTKLVGLGFDGCSTVAGKENGVQAIIKRKYESVSFFHCASHKLNLVVNDLNSLPEIRNTTSTVKEIINFFRESILRRRLFPNIPLLCETRWSEKYKSKLLFYENFIAIKTALDELAVNKDGNSSSRSRTFQLSCAASKDTFVVCLIIISTYSSILEPVVNKFVKTNLYTVHQYIKTSLLSILRMHRTQCDRYFKNIFETIKKTTIDLDIEIKIPRLSNKQTNRSNHNVTTLEQYYRVSLFLPYLDSLINSLESRFTQSNEIPFKISNLHPSEVIKLSKSDFICTLKNINDLYNIDNLIEEGNTWYDYWNITENSTKFNEECNISYYLKDCQFFPSVKKCIMIYMTIPPTTCTIERSFSTLRCVKTWLAIRSSDYQKIDDLNLIQGVVDEFSKNKRNLQFLF